ncbi:hypothetical protein GGI12_006282 [Dipsacomyces acuminosporus]|nr:hypothetical protein GGI12_006282 [Dipsacomyces acuminosporus]
MSDSNTSINTATLRDRIINISDFDGAVMKTAVASPGSGATSATASTNAEAIVKETHDSTPTPGAALSDQKGVQTNKASLANASKSGKVPISNSKKPDTALGVTREREPSMKHIRGIS